MHRWFWCKGIRKYARISIDILLLAETKVTQHQGECSSFLVRRSPRAISPSTLRAQNLFTFLINKLSAKNRYLLIPSLLRINYTAHRQTSRPPDYSSALQVSQIHCCRSAPAQLTLTCTCRPCPLSSTWEGPKYASPSLRLCPDSSNPRFVHSRTSLYATVIHPAFEVDIELLPGR